MKGVHDLMTTVNKRLYIYIYMCVCVSLYERHSCCNDYRRRKWTR